MADLTALFNIGTFDTPTRYLLDITLIMIIGGVSALVFSRLRMPAVIGYLMAGIIVGPAFPLHLVQDVDLINFMADLGIILLMFTIGLDFNLKKLKAIGLSAVLAGAIEVSLMIALGYLLGLALGWGSIEALFLGAVMAGSSTAVIVKVLTETGRIREEHATTLIGLLIVEDFASVFILALTSPIITGATLTTSSIIVTAITINAFVAISLILGIAVIPKTMDLVHRKYSSETLLLVSLGLCFGLAFVSFLLGFSVAIGAFMMGIIISQSNAVKEVVAKTTPIEEMFLAVFFVSIGMLIDPLVIWNNLWIVLLIAAVFIAGKTLAVSAGAYAANIEGPKAVTIGLSMVAMGEFAYVIAKMGTEAGVVSADFYSTIIGASLVTMLVVPWSIKRSDRTVWWLVRHLPRGVKEDLRHLESVRSAVRQRLSISPERKRALHREALWVLVDVTFLFGVLVIADVVHGFELMLNYLESVVPVIPLLIFVWIVFALLLPVTLSIIKRVRRIADIMAAAAVESGRYSMRIGRLIYRMFMALLSIMLFAYMISLASPMLSILEDLGVQAIFVIVLVGGVLIYLSWNVFDSVHNKVCTELGRGILSEDGPPEAPQYKGPGESSG